MKKGKLIVSTALAFALAAGAVDQAAKATTSKVLVNGKEISFTAYEINDYNYFKLRDVYAALDIEVGWDAATQTITLTITDAAEEGFQLIGTLRLMRMGSMSGCSH